MYFVSGISGIFTATSGEIAIKLVPVFKVTLIFFLLFCPWSGYIPFIYILL
jgi:hypothetical protein